MMLLEMLILCWTMLAIERMGDVKVHDARNRCVLLKE